MGDITIQAADLHGVKASRVTINPGGSWSKDLKEEAGTSSCQKGHVGFVLSGKLSVQMDNGSKEVYEKGDAFTVPPGHDAWCEGQETVLFVEFSKGADYYADRTSWVS